MSNNAIAALIGGFLGSLIPTFLLSRLFLWLTKRRNDDINRLLIAHGLSLALSTLLGGLGAMAGGNGFAVGSAFLQYLVPQLIWFGVDIVAQKGRKSRQVLKDSVL